MGATMTQNIFEAAVSSVERRGFHDTIQHARFANAPVMAAFLIVCHEMGQLARAMRQGTDSEVNHQTWRVEYALDYLSDAMVRTGDPQCSYAHEPFLMQEFVGRVEELGELAEALWYDDAENVRYELADGVIVDAQIAHLLGIDLEHAMRNKLTLDEVRGYLHGQTQTDVNGSG